MGSRQGGRLIFSALSKLLLFHRQYEISSAYDIFSNCTLQVLFNLLLQSPDENNKEESDLDDLLGDNLHVLQVRACDMQYSSHIRTNVLFFNIYHQTIQVALDELRETAEDCTKEMEGHEPDFRAYSDFIHVASALLRHVCRNSGEYVSLPV